MAADAYKYYKGDGVEVNVKKAINLIHELSLSSDAMSLYRIANLFKLGSPKHNIPESDIMNYALLVIAENNCQDKIDKKTIFNEKKVSSFPGAYNWRLTVRA